MAGRIDLVIFGATGFTGKVAVSKILKLVKERNITWGVAGRSASRLHEVLTEVSNKTGQDLQKIPVIVADVKDEKSLLKMAAKAKVVVNYVGPYHFYGEPVVKACIENGTHHVDVSGEPQYMEQMQLKYNKAAEEKGSYIVNGCGFSGIPADLGLIHLIQSFKGVVNSMETYHEFKFHRNPQVTPVHYASWESAVNSLKHAAELLSLRKELFSQILPTPSPKLLKRQVLHKSGVINKWCLPFPAADKSVMVRSQHQLYVQEGARPVQVAAYISFNTLNEALLFTAMGGLAALMGKTSFTRNLLLKHPKIFSVGLVSHEGPSQECMDNTEFSITFHGKGWTEQKTINDGHNTPLNKTMVLKVKVRDPGYGFTTVAHLLAAITILGESHKMPGKGGVLPPGAAFAKTSLIKELSANGLKFEIVKDELINQEIKKNDI